MLNTNSILLYLRRELAKKLAISNERKEQTIVEHCNKNYIMPNYK